MPLTTLTAGATARASDVNNNFALCLLTDTARTCTVTQTWTASQTFTGGFTTGAAVTLGGNLLFTDATYDIGASGATRPRHLFMSGNATVGGTLALTGAATLSSTLAVTGATTLSAALTYGGVTLANAVTGTGNMVLSASPTLTGTALAASLTLSGTLALAGATVSGTPTWSSSQAITLSTAAQPNVTSVGTLTSLTVSGQIVGKDGSAASPSFRFSTGTTGWFLSASETIGAALAGVEKLTFSATSFALASGVALSVSSNATVAVGSGVPLTVEHTGVASALRVGISMKRGGAQKYVIGFNASDEFDVLNAAGTASNLSVTDAGAGTFRAGLTIAGALSGVTTLTATGQLKTTVTTQQLALHYDASNHLAVTVSSAGAVTYNATGASASHVFSDAVTIDGLLTMQASVSYLFQSSALLPFNNGANTATLTNSPTTGNPAKWVPIRDTAAATTYYIPMWT